MIKQISVKNLYNFKNEITIDLLNSGKDEEVLSKTYNKDSIGNLTLLYGKNNVGKSNFFQILKEVQIFVLENKNLLEPYNPSSDKLNSSFEFIIENSVNEIRYGFEINLKRNQIIDEWLFSKINGSSRETLIFDRNFEAGKPKFSQLISKVDINSMSNLKKEILFLNYFNNKKETIEVIADLLDEFRSLEFISCVGGSDTGDDLPGFFSLYENEENREIINLFLKSADLDITDIKFSELSDEENEFMNKMRLIDSMEIDSKDKERKIADLLETNTAILPNLIRKNLIGRVLHEGDIEPIYMEFMHKSGASFPFERLSSGTKQIISILMRVIIKFRTKSVLFFDEIETGLHSELVDLLLKFFKLTLLVNPDLQYIITTHQEELLDYDFISNDNKVFMKVNPVDADIEIEYLSEYKLRDYQLPSKRYRLNAFETNPNTSSEYNLFSFISNLKKEKN